MIHMSQSRCALMDVLLCGVDMPEPEALSFDHVKRTRAQTARCITNYM